jgi:hypothetical protein
LNGSPRISVIISGAGSVAADALRGCEAFLEKPVHLDLLRMIAGVLRR